MAEARIQADLIVRDADVLVTPRGNGPVLGEQTRVLRTIEKGCIASKDGTIVFVGDGLDLEKEVEPVRGCRVVDAVGRTILPGFVDPHTHPVYAGDRAGEFARRLAGEAYEKIAAEGGGILSTVRSTRKATEEELTHLSRKRLDWMLLHGTTTAEVKSGYGLSMEAELKQLHAIRDLDASHAMELVPTFLGAHAVPEEFSDRREAYVRILCEEMIPAVVKEGLARYCDVFCEEGVFSVDESRQILETAKKEGLELRVHADELSASGGAMLAAKLGAATADHLVHITSEAIEAMAEAGTTAVMLPATTFFLRKKKYAPALRLLDAGVPLALATDCNPGSSNTESMPMAMVVGCLQMGLSVEQAIHAATINAAYSLGRNDTVGSLEVGKSMDLVLIRAPSHLHLVYHFGVNLVDTVIKKGEVVVEGSRLVAAA